MIRYTVRCERPHRHFVEFEGIFPHDGSDFLELQQAAWRPGRYELGNFAKNVVGWKASSTNGEALPARKVTKDLWRVEAPGLSEVVIRYTYYAAEMNAGSSYLDEYQLYLNPVNCFFFLPRDPGQGYSIRLVVPEAYTVACGLRQPAPHVLEAASFDELADCPLIASADLRHLQYDVAGVRFHIWMQGDHKLDDELLLRQFEAFTRSHFDLFGGIPCTEYHFLFQFAPYFVRHGVEHHNSTVIAMGPAADGMNAAWYNEFLGISCHELFHTWNIKNIRPAEMMPYDFTRENYSRLGYVAEGVTTYYGDLLLFRSGVFEERELLRILSGHLQDHFDNTGRFNLSVADSSFDTWLDGYTPGVPGRKVSIYNEGCLVAFICDIFIMETTRGEKSLDDVLRKLYERFGKKGIGYTEEDYWSLLDEVAGTPTDAIRRSIVEGTGDYLPWLTRSFSHLGYRIVRTASPKWSEAYLGFSVDESGQRAVITSVLPDSPADRAGLWKDDEISTVNQTMPYKNFQSLLRMQSGREIELGVIRKNRRQTVIVRDDGSVWMEKWSVVPVESRTEEQHRAWSVWSGRSGGK